MREHPIPQDITGYRFHIVGNMTLKQFAEVGAGCIVAIILYKTGLPDFIKWPMVVFSFGLGALAAFVPIEERPIDHWIATFISIMYKPTQYFWKRIPFIPSAFAYQTETVTQPLPAEVDLSPARRHRVKEFMASIQAVGFNRYDLDQSEKAQIGAILNLFGQTQVVVNQTKPKVVKPQLDVRVRKLGKLDRSRHSSDKMFEAAIIMDQSDKKRQAKPKKAGMTTSQIAKQITIPITPNLDIEAEPISDEELAISHRQADDGDRAYIQNQPQDQLDTNQAKSALFNASLPFPTAPTEPNKLVGMVLTPRNELIPGAIIEVKTLDGHTTRAVKSNALGQFYVTTPLKNGQYVVEIEKDGFKFEPQKLEVAGKNLQPMEVRSV
ncbi:MAG: PrgI family protein [Patescibacteria group bacterium]|nr:PrgI family protein [Patescibacteria group bacterium]